MRILSLHSYRELPRPQPSGVFVGLHDHPRLGSRARLYSAHTRITDGHRLRAATRPASESLIRAQLERNSLIPAGRSR